MIIDMQPNLTLISHPSTLLQTQQILISSKFLNTPIILQTSLLPFSQTPLSQTHPFGSYPYLLTHSGPLFSTPSILKYLARLGKTMYGKNLIEHTEIDSLLDFYLLEVSPVINAIQNAISSTTPLTKRVYNLYFFQLKKILHSLNERMKYKQWMAGGWITIADFSLIPYIHYLFTQVIDQKGRMKLECLVGWYQNIIHTNKFIDIIGCFTLCIEGKIPIKWVVEDEQTEVVLNLDLDIPKKKQQQQQKTQFPNYISKIKHQFLTSPDPKLFLHQLFHNLDTTNHSIYKIQYQSYSNQCSDQFKAINVRSSILSNLETLKDSSFAVTGVYGTEGNYIIKGVWLFDTSYIPDVWEQHPLYNYHCYTKWNPGNQTQGEAFKEYWMGLGAEKKVEGQPVVTAKYFG